MHHESQPVFLEARWRHLLLLNFEVPADHLRRQIPRGTVLDFVALDEDAGQTR